MILTALIAGRNPDKNALRFPRPALFPLPHLQTPSSSASGASDKSFTRKSVQIRFNRRDVFFSHNLKISSIASLAELAISHFLVRINEMPPYPNLISDSLLITETIRLLQNFGGRAPGR
jgi:hypothetical protein